MKSHFITLLVLIVGIPSLAQTDTTFYNEKGERAYGEYADAVYYELNNGLNREGQVEQFYLNHKRYAIVTYADNYLHGYFERYYGNGQKKEEGEYENGRNSKYLKRWYHNGQLYAVYKLTKAPDEKINRKAFQNGTITTKLINAWDSLGNQQVIDGNGYFDGPKFDDRKVWKQGKYANGLETGKWQASSSGKELYTELYDENGLFVSGVSYNDDGTQNEYTKLEEDPSYPGGQKKWLRFLQKNLKYPREAMRKDIEGSVFLSFIVNKDGTTSDIRVVSGPGAGCEEEAVRVIKKSKNWIPAIVRGKKVKTRMLLQIIFRLR